MGWFDYVSDLYSSVSVQSAEADRGHPSDDLHDASGEFGSSKDQKGGVGTAQHDRGAAVKGGVSAGTPHAGTNEESDAEAEVNKEQIKTPEAPKGHKPGDAAGKEAAGQVGADKAGPHGGPVGPKNDVVHSDGDDGEEEEEEAGDEEEEEEEEEDEEEDEPEDLMPKFQAQCEKTAACAPLKHHYDECAERVTKQHEEHGRADEDCVEEFFHLMHCTTQCAAPKLFRALR